jgi:hypothetical protein
MAEYPTYTREDVVNATGRADEEIGDFIDEAIVQATLLFQLGTCLKDFPDNAMDAATARYAILYMAEAIEGVQKYQEVLRNPFSSETIGSYSYSKLSTAVSAGLPTGISWFDIAIGRLGVCHLENHIPMSGGWNVFEENKEAHDGYGVFLGPDDQSPDTWGPNTIESM